MIIYSLIFDVLLCSLQTISKPQKKPSFLSTFLDGNRSSHPRVISAEVMSPETCVMLPEILVVSRKKKSSHPKKQVLK